MLTISSEQVIEALAEQVRHYRELAKLSIRQRHYIQNDQTEELISVLSERETHLSRITELERTVGPRKKNWGDFLGGLGGEARREAEEAMAETRRLLAEITAGDERDALTLQQKKLRIGNEITATNKATVVNRQYAASAYGRARPSNLDQRT